MEWEQVGGGSNWVGLTNIYVRGSVPGVGGYGRKTVVVRLSEGLEAWARSRDQDTGRDQRWRRVSLRDTLSRGQSRRVRKSFL